MRICWAFAAIWSLLASLLVPGIASASSAAGAETHVRAFEVAEQARVGGSAALTPELHRGCAPTYDELASDSLLAARGGDDLVDLSTPARRRHILDGDATGGGHRAGTGLPGKSEFPGSWSDDQIMHHISDIATDPAATRTAGRGGRTIVDGTRGGVQIRVVLEPDGSIVTGFPTSLPRNR